MKEERIFGASDQYCTIAIYAFDECRPGRQAELEIEFNSPRDGTSSGLLLDFDTVVDLVIVLSSWLERP